MCHISVSFSNFIPYGPISSANARNSLMSENSSALNGIAPSAVRLTKALWLLEKQIFPALTRRSSTSEYLKSMPSFSGYIFNIGALIPKLILLLIMVHTVLRMHMARKMAICTYKKHQYIPLLNTMPNNNYYTLQNKICNMLTAGT